MGSRADVTDLEAVMAEIYTEEGLTPDSILGVPDVIPTGCLGLDYILGIDGWPRGRSVELSGASQSGKTTSAAMAVVQAQRQGFPVVYIDFEQALDETYLRTLGVDVDDHKLFVPYLAPSIEKGMAAAHKAANTGKVGLIVFDSVGAMVPQSYVDGWADSRTFAMDRARILGNAFSALTPILRQTNTCAIFINHTMDVIETGPTRPGMPKRTTTSGGKSVKYLPSVRCEFKVVKTYKRDVIDAITGEKVSEPHAVEVIVKVTKNRLAPPFRSVNLYLEFGRGFRNTHTAMTALVTHRVVRKSGAFFYFPDHLYHPQMKSGDKGASLQGLQAALDLGAMDPSWEERLVAAARAALPRLATEEVVSVEAVDDIGPIVPSPENVILPVSDTAAPAPEPVGEEQVPVSGRRVQFVDTI